MFALIGALQHSVPAAAGAVAFARTVLRTHTLQRLSRAVAGTTTHLQTVKDALGAVDLEQADLEGACLWACVQTLKYGPDLVSNLAALVARAALCSTEHAAPEPAPPRSAAERDAYAVRQREWRRLEVAKRVLIGEFVAHMAASGVMEHQARALTTAAIATSAAVTAEAGVLASELIAFAPDSYNALLCTWSRLHALCITAVSPDDAARLQAILSGPCLWHLTVSTGLDALSYADGGSSHGLPQALLDGLPVLGGVQALGPNEVVRVLRILDLDLQGQPAWLSTHTFKTLVAYLGGAAAPHPPSVGPRAAVSVLLRVGRLALQSVRAWSQPEAVVAAGDLGVLLGPPRSMDPVKLLWACLTCTDGLLPSPAPGGWAEAALLQRWRLAVGTIEHVSPWLAHVDQDTAARFVAEPLVRGDLFQPDGSLPAAPSPTVAAALAAGLVPALEHLVRRAGESLPAAGLLIRLLKYTAGGLLERLFAHSNPVEMTGLLVSLAKLLRRRYDGDGLGVNFPIHLSMVYRDLDSALRAASSPVSAAAAAGVSAAPAAGQASRHLTTALAASALLWLPELARLGREEMAALGDPWAVLASPHDSIPLPGVLAWVLEGVFAWLELLPFLPESGPTVAGGDGAAADGAAGGGGAGGGSGWRRLLVEEVAAVPLLAAALRLAPRWKPVVDGRHLDVCMMRLTTACAAVAVAAPEAVQRAALAGAAASAASSIKRNRRWRSSSAAAQLAAAWQPQQFRDLAYGMAETEASGHVQLALSVGDIVAGWGRAGAVAASQLAALRAELAALLALTEKCDVQSAARALPDLDQVRAALPPACAHPGCACLDGDSEAGLRLSGYAEGVAGAVYCSRGCAAHHSAARLRARARG
ncbi:hypothetical protein HYH03_000978 [Edaphochlamys debaryana]|uniref:Uncharacterized protein n=1 Tax=Edaphochlamys debaryana TaxID=47281 RepID=A0A836C6I2_9CHLO|nr:hypothetical protein HYH03_000978 [Edaphochlamys debaryana]|eukprot:KAG2501163.1 hypothetical protein HYH03_000978 [Edaphochlamys debaryana]